jgi:signal transduction histidine kinase
VTDAAGRIRGHLYGGVLLNGNLDLVDRIRDLVFGAETFEGIEIGSATLFLGDLRVATTIRLKNGERAIGTMISPEVARAVLEERQSWLARAKVVDNWYLTAYQGMLGEGGKVIGALYVGQLEAPFTALKRQAALALFVLLLFGGTLGYLLARSFAARLSRPILELEAGAGRVAAGDREILLPIAAGDEVGRLTEAFNRMTGALRSQEEQLQSLNRDLERKVAERTLLLEEKNRQLVRTQEELARAERLAAVGSLAAGVAHEINNPAAIIRGNVEILLAGRSADHPEREEAEEILRQTERLARITASLLTFAREQSVRREPVQVNRLLEDVLAQVGHQTDPGRVEILCRLAADLPTVMADGERLRQVFNNLALNALQALAGEGRLEIVSRRNGEVVEVSFTDNGPGIAAAVREKIFHPFFTTRSAGSGLGLSVSYGIVQALGGRIEVASEAGRGSTFTVVLPLRGAAD